MSRETGQSEECDLCEAPLLSSAIKDLISRHQFAQITLFVLKT